MLTRALLLCLLLSACSGSDGDETTAVLAVGDSTFTPYWPQEPSTPELAAASIPGVVLNNIAVSGTTACQADLAVIEKAHASVVVANYGLNEAYGNNGMPRHDLVQYAECLNRISDAARTAGSRLVLLAANPVLPSPGWDATRIDQYNLVKQRIPGAHYCALPEVTWSLRELTDGQHPNMNVKPKIATALAACIRLALLNT